MATTKVNHPDLLDLASDTGATVFPKGTTEERPVSPEAGYIRFNTTDNVMETYDGTEWLVLDTLPPSYAVDYLVIAGGGGGGNLGGGGGGTPYGYSGGPGGLGGGGNGAGSGSPDSGLQNTGSGGGGSGSDLNGNDAGGNGGSGVVILRMPTVNYTGTTTGSPTVTTDGTDTILTYTSSGTYTA